MAAISHERGWRIQFCCGKWIYADSGKPINGRRACKRCGRKPTIGGHDACTGYISGASSVCCGHGVAEPILKY